MIELNKIVAALAADKTDDCWYEWRIYFRRTANGECEVMGGHVSPLERDIEVVGHVKTTDEQGLVVTFNPGSAKKRLV